MANLFATATVKKTVKKSDKETVSIPALAATIETFNEAKERIDFYTSQLEGAQAEIHAAGKTAYLDLYRRLGKNPDSFVIRADDDHSVMYLPTDKYKTIDEERVSLLREKYGDIAETITEFSLDGRLVEKYSQVLSDLILGSPDISEADKAALIVAKAKHSVKKGSIDKLLSAPDPAEMLEDIAPVIQLKRM